MKPLTWRPYRAGLVGAPVFYLLLLAGCASLQGQGDGGNRKLPDAFACTEYFDENRDGLVQPHEFRGIRDTFYLTDRITFVAHYEGLGSQIIWRLYGPDGTVHRSGTSHGRFDRAYRWMTWEVRDLIGRDLTGSWRMEWHVEGVPTRTTRVRLIR
jgi:hypothetical protein